MALNEGQYTGEFLEAEAPGKISRDQVVVTVPGATTYVDGQVLGKIAASGKYVAYDETATDGRETAAGVLYGNLENDAVSAADFDGVIVNWSAEVDSADLEWGGADETAGTADLAALGIKVRTNGNA